jgi:hypothetical protein
MQSCRLSRRKEETEKAQPLAVTKALETLVNFQEIGKGLRDIFEYLAGRCRFPIICAILQLAEVGDCEDTAWRGMGSQATWRASMGGFSGANRPACKQEALW